MADQWLAQAQLLAAWGVDTVATSSDAAADSGSRPARTTDPDARRAEIAQLFNMIK